MEEDRFLTHSLRDRRLARILATALEAAEPGQLVARYLQGMGLPAHNRLFLLAFGKAAEPMARAAADFFGDFDAALAITKHSAVGPSPGAEPPIPEGSLRQGQQSRLHVLEAGHPIPDDRSLAAGAAALQFASQLREDDLLICLISGGGSALVAAPPKGISLTDLQRLTTALLASGAAVEEINILRRKLDRIKGGGLVAACRGKILSLILSDVVGDQLEAIASGPTVPDSTSGDDALAILKQYSIEAPPSVLAVLHSTQPAWQPRTFERLHNVIIGNNSTAAEAASLRAGQEGFNSSILDTDLHGEARLAGARLAKTLEGRLANASRPFCLIAGGETTVTVRGSGKGGRNQELALAAVDILDGLHDVLLATLATDGDEGPTDAAGAVASGDTRIRAAGLGMLASDYLSRNDAYPFFEALRDLLKPGYTGTNVNDLVLLCGL